MQHISALFLKAASRLRQHRSVLFSIFGGVLLLLGAVSLGLNGHFEKAFPVHAAGNTYHVSAGNSSITAGDDARSCATATNIATPKKTIASGLSCVSAGNTLYIRGGTYAESIDNNQQTIPMGMSWTDAPRIAAYPGESVTLSGLRLAGPSDDGRQQSIQYVVFDGLKFNASSAPRAAISLWGRVNHIRIQNCEAFGSVGTGAGIEMYQGWPGSDRGGFNEIVNCKVHDNIGVFPGQEPRSGTVTHGLYINMDNNLFDRLEVTAMDI